MPVQVSCPHCRALCLVAEKHLGVPVQCGRCGRTFTTRAAAAAAPPLVRLDVGIAASPGRARPHGSNNFLVRQLSWSNLDERHEAAVLVVADEIAIRAASAVLIPLLNDIFNGTVKDAAISEAIAAALREDATRKDTSAAAVVVIRDGQAHLGYVGAGRAYHQRAGRLAEIVVDSLKLVAGDGMLVCVGLHTPALPAEIAQTSSSAVELAQQLVERSGQLSGDPGMVAAVRCY